jgi:hypothetical protein
MGSAMTPRQWARLARDDRCMTDAQLMQRRCFASVPPKGERLMHRASSTGADWCGSGARTN